MARPIYFASRFPRTWRSLSSTQKEKIFNIILALPELLRNPHRHSGFGFRRLHGNFFFEARLDLRLRLIIRIDATEIILFDVLSHDEVRRMARK